MKYCNKCGETKKLEEFSVCKRNKSGRQSACKACNSAHYSKNAERVKKYQSERYYSNHKEELLKRAENRKKPEFKIKKRLSDKKWIENNREYYNLRSRAHCANRRARLRDIPGKLHADEVAELLRVKNKCSYCGATEDLCIDHVVPVSKGGHNTLSNLEVACMSCNSSKNNKDLKYWLWLKGYRRSS